MGCCPEPRDGSSRPATPVRSLPLTAAGRLFIALAVLLPLVGVVVLHRVSFRTREMWPFSAVVVAYNGLFFWISQFRRRDGRSPASGRALVARA
jgi:hypothetical protein